MTPESVKRRIEEEYEWEGRSVDAGTDHVGQMTVAFCAMCPTLDDECPTTVE